MERYIDRLQLAAVPDEITLRKPVEFDGKLKAERPTVISSVTFGKEPHAGHLLLFGIGEQVRSAFGGEIPLIIINNNTGPRPAGTLKRLALDKGLGLEEMAIVMQSGGVEKSEIVNAYRNRDDSDIAEAQELLAQKGLDIFSAIASDSQQKLREGGFSIEVVSEAGLLVESEADVEGMNPLWSGSGFMPFVDGKRVILAKKAGSLTATGAIFSSINAVAKRYQADLMLPVDSEADGMDASYVLTSTTEVRGMQTPGAGVGFGGKIASGTKGQAYTAEQVLRRFEKEDTKGSLKRAIVYMTLDLPISIPIDSADMRKSFYDFKDNESMVSAILEADRDCSRFIGFIEEKLDELGSKIGDVSIGSGRKTEDMLKYMDKRYDAFKNVNLSKVLGKSRNIKIIEDENIVSDQAQRLGYDQDDNPYAKGERRLAFRNNFYFGHLKDTLRDIEGIESLSPGDFDKIIDMVNTCMKRIGI